MTNEDITINPIGFVIRKIFGIFGFILGTIPIGMIVYLCTIGTVNIRGLRGMMYFNIILIALACTIELPMLFHNLFYTVASLLINRAIVNKGKNRGRDVQDGK